MTPQKIIDEVKENASEWIEMSANPHEFICGVLANKIISLENYIDYLEKRVDYVTNSHNNR